MNDNTKEDAKAYLYRFDQILSQMANKMLSARIMNNITIDFIDCMIPHHQAAIYMCENLLKYTKYQPLEEIAKNIIETQTKGINQMREIMKTTMGYQNNYLEVNNYMIKYLEITRIMIYEMETAPRYVNIDLNFVNEMIPHHEGAIKMCNNLIRYCIDPRLKDIAISIIKEQSLGVEQLKEIKDQLKINY